MNLLLSSSVYISEKGADDMEEFERLLEKERISVERFVRYHINSKPDAEDVLQEVFFTAYKKFSQLKNKESFKAWLISIARNKCNDYFRKKAEQYEIPIGFLADKAVSDGRYGISVVDTVRETFSLLGDKDKQILYLYFWKELPQSEIANKLNIPVGTVKSRLHTAKQNFKNKFPNYLSEGDNNMKKLPEYKISDSEGKITVSKTITASWSNFIAGLLVGVLLASGGFAWLRQYHPDGSNSTTTILKLWAEAEEVSSLCKVDLRNIILYFLQLDATRNRRIFIGIHRKIKSSDSAKSCP